MNIQTLIDQLENMTRDKLMSQAVTQKFNGDIKVNPNKVYIDPETGKRAVENLKKLLSK